MFKKLKKFGESLRKKTSKEEKEKKTSTKEEEEEKDKKTDAGASPTPKDTPREREASAAATTAPGVGPSPSASEHEGDGDSRPRTPANADAAGDDEHDKAAATTVVGNIDRDDTHMDAVEEMKSCSQFIVVNDSSNNNDIIADSNVCDAPAGPPPPPVAAPAPEALHRTDTPPRSAREDSIDFDQVEPSGPATPVVPPVPAKEKETKKKTAPSTSSSPPVEKKEQSAAKLASGSSKGGQQPKPPSRTPSAAARGKANRDADSTAASRKGTPRLPDRKHTAERVDSARNSSTTNQQQRRDLSADSQRSRSSLRDTQRGSTRTQTRAGGEGTTPRSEASAHTDSSEYHRPQQQQPQRRSGSSHKSSTVGGIAADVQAVLDQCNIGSKTLAARRRQNGRAKSPIQRSSANNKHYVFESERYDNNNNNNNNNRSPHRARSKTPPVGAWSRSSTPHSEARWVEDGDHRRRGSRSSRGGRHHAAAVPSLSVRDIVESPKKYRSSNAINEEADYYSEEGDGYHDEVRFRVPERRRADYYGYHSRGRSRSKGEEDIVQSPHHRRRAAQSSTSSPRSTPQKRREGKRRDSRRQSLSRSPTRRQHDEEERDRHNLAETPTRRRRKRSTGSYHAAAAMSSTPPSPRPLETEQDILAEVELKLQQLGKIIEREDTQLEEEMMSDPWRRLYHLNNRRDRDIRRERIVQYNKLLSIREKIVTGALDREVQEREEQRQRLEALYDDPDGVYMRLYNSSPMHRTAAAAADNTNNSRSSTPRRRAAAPRRSASTDSRGSGGGAVRPEKDLDALFNRLYQVGMAEKRTREKNVKETQLAKRKQEMEDFLVARLVGRLQRQSPARRDVSEEAAREQLRRDMSADPKATSRDLLRGNRLSSEEQELVAKRLTRHGYVSRESLARQKAAQQLKDCTFSPQVNEDYVSVTTTTANNAGRDRSPSSVQRARCEKLYEKGVRARERAEEARVEKERAMRLDILKSRLANDHHFRKRVALDPALAERYVKSLAV